MWTILSGYILSTIFEYLIAKLHKNNFSNKNMILLEVILGWLFQEHIRQDFNVTSGKRFMLKKDFRNRFITQSIKIIRNIIFWIHLINILELGTLIFLLLLLFYILFNQYFRFFPKKVLSIKEFIIFPSIIMQKIQKNCRLIILLFIVFLLFLKTYSVFDFFFIARPFFLLFIVISNYVYIFGGIFLICLYILNLTSPQNGKYIFFSLYKIFLYMNLLNLLTNLIIIETNLEIFQTENFFKELLFKILLFN